MQVLRVWTGCTSGGEGARRAGHRLVHGGRAHRAPHVLTAGVVADPRELVRFDPDHLPQALAVIQVTAIDARAAQGRIIIAHLGTAPASPPFANPDPAVPW